jgi:hypothetical protein
LILLCCIDIVVLCVVVCYCCVCCICFMYLFSSCINLASIVHICVISLINTLHDRHFRNGLKEYGANKTKGLMIGFEALKALNISVKILKGMPSFSQKYVCCILIQLHNHYTQSLDLVCLFNFVVQTSDHKEWDSSRNDDFLF